MESYPFAVAGIKCARVTFRMGRALSLIKCADRFVWTDYSGQAHRFRLHAFTDSLGHTKLASLKVKQFVTALTSFRLLSGLASHGSFSS